MRAVWLCIFDLIKGKGGRNEREKARWNEGEGTKKRGERNEMCQRGRKCVRRPELYQMFIVPSQRNTIYAETRKKAIT